MMRPPRCNPQAAVTVFRARRNPTLFHELGASGALEPAGAPGVWRVLNVTGLPPRVIITEELEGAAHAAFRALTDRARGSDVTSVVEAAGREPDEAVRAHYGALIGLVLEKNPAVADEIGRGRGMEDVLMELVRDRVDERVSAERRETRVLDIRGVMREFGVGVERAMDAIGIPPEQREEYARLVGTVGWEPSRRGRAQPKLFALVLAAVMAVALAVPAWADPVTNTHTIAIDNTDQNVAHTYVAYKVFSGNLDADESTLSDIAWADVVKGDDLTGLLSNGMRAGCWPLQGRSRRAGLIHAAHHPTK